MELKSDRIIRRIMDGLTGDPEHDRPYLQEQMEKYSATKWADDVSGACQHILTELGKNEGPALTGHQAALSGQIAVLSELIESSKKEIEKEKKQVDFANKIISEQSKALELVHEDRLEEADTILTSLISEMEASFTSEADEDHIYCSFDDTFQSVLYTHQFHTTKPVINLQIPFSCIYCSCGKVNLILGRLDKARNMFLKSLEWNPFDADSLLDLIRIYIERDDHETAFQMLQSVFCKLYQPEDIAYALNLAVDCFIAQDQIKEAGWCILAASSLDPDSSATQYQQNLYVREHGGLPSAPTVEELEELENRYGFSLGPDPEIIDLAVARARVLEKKNKDLEGALELYQIAGRLTADRSVHQSLNNLERKVSRSTNR